jgi:hypothetical protein
MSDVHGEMSNKELVAFMREADNFVQFSDMPASLYKAVKIAIERLAQIPAADTSRYAGHESVVEMIDGHTLHWRGLLEHAISHSVSPVDSSFWTHELKALDAIIVAVNLDIRDKGRAVGEAVPVDPNAVERESVHFTAHNQLNDANDDARHGRQS